MNVLKVFFCLFASFFRLLKAATSSQAFSLSSKASVRAGEWRFKASSSQSCNVSLVDNEQSAQECRSCTPPEILVHCLGTSRRCTLCAFLCRIVAVLFHHQLVTPQHTNGVLKQVCSLCTCALDTKRTSFLYTIVHCVHFSASVQLVHLAVSNSCITQRQSEAVTRTKHQASQTRFLFSQW